MIAATTQPLSARGVRAANGARAALLLAGGGAAVGLRWAAGGPIPAASLGAATLFAAVLLLLTAAAGWRPHWDGHWRRSLALGVLGAALLVAGWLSAAPHLWPAGGRPVASLLPWTAAVVLVAVAEEVALRGALFAALRAWRGAGGALAVTTVAFALLHVPLYGWGALPLDLAAGLLFGGLRLISGGVTAPAVAHVLADLAAGWLV